MRNVYDYRYFQDFCKYYMYFSIRPSCDHVYGSLVRVRKLMDADGEKNLTLTCWFKFSF